MPRVKSRALPAEFPNAFYRSLGQPIELSTVVARDAIESERSLIATVRFVIGILIPQSAVTG